MLAFVLFVAAWPLKAQHRHHPPEHVQLHESFYRNLVRPDQPGAQPGSCCGNYDCYPTQAEVRGGQWYALRREDQAWIPVPHERVIRDETSPDGRAHLCAVPGFVYCFVPPPSGV